MPRRKKIKKKKKWVILSALKKSRRSEARFRVSLVFLIAGLAFSLFLFLLTLIGTQSGRSAAKLAPVLPAGTAAADSSFSKNPLLKDPNLDFTLKIPPQLGEWLYKIGYVKSPVDETLSNQYVNIYIPQSTNSSTNNFDDLAKSILSIRQFSQKEWVKLEKGCQKGNQFYCETAGVKVGEKDSRVFAYIKPGDCPKRIEAKCRLAGTIIKSFTLK
jgi:hypothetical protein